jgi:hypothetical protein
VQGREGEGHSGQLGAGWIKEVVIGTNVEKLDSNRIDLIRYVIRQIKHESDNITHSHTNYLYLYLYLHL